MDRTEEAFDLEGKADAEQRDYLDSEGNERGWNLRPRDWNYDEDSIDLWAQWREEQGLPPAGLRQVGENHSLACKRVAASKVYGVLPRHYLETLEQNQLIASCCRHPENHEVEAWFSGSKDAKKGIPDIYKFHCTCGRTHARFCVGKGDTRPLWRTRRRWWLWGREVVRTSMVVGT